MNFDIFIPVRLSSTRLANKAMIDLNGKPIIKYLIERMQHTKNIKNVVVCTTTNTSDDKLSEYLQRENVEFFRGSEKDILGRFLNAARKLDTDFIIAVDGDDIYADPSIVDNLVGECKKTNADYVQIKGVPVGFTPIGIKKSALEKICTLKKSENTETGYGRFFTQTNLFNVCDLTITTRKFMPNLRLSLDYKEDFDVAKEIFGALGNDFHLEDVLKFLEVRPDLMKTLNDLENKWNKHWDTNLSDISLKDI